MKGLYDALPAWRRPVLVLLGLITVGLVSQIPTLEAEFEPEALVPTEPDEEARIEAAFAGFERTEEPLVVLVEAPDVLAPPTLSFVHRLARAFEDRPWVERVEGLTTTPLPRAPTESALTLDTLDDAAPVPPALERALGRVVATDPQRFPMGLASLPGAVELAPLVDGAEVTDADRARIEAAVERGRLIERRLIDAEHETTVVAMLPRTRLDEAAATEAVAEVSAWLTAHRPPDGVNVRVGGMPAVRAAMAHALRSDQLTLVGLAILGSFVVLLIGFRSWAGVLLPLGAAGMTSGMVVGGMALFGEPLNLLNNVVPPLLITVGIGDAVHLLVRYREELGRDPDRLTAARRTMRAMVVACFLTSATTAVGFTSLVVSETAVMQRFGILAALGVMLAYVVTVLFLPAALPDFSVRPVPAGRRALLDREVALLTSIATRRPGLVIAIAIALLAGGLLAGRGVRIDSALLDQLEPGSEAARTAARMEGRLDGVRAFEVGLTGEPGRYRTAQGLREAAEIEAWLRARPEVLRVSGPASLTEALWGWLGGDDTSGGALATDERAAALAALAGSVAAGPWRGAVDDEAARARVEVRLRDVGERAINALVDRIEERFEGAVVGGEARRSARGLERLVADLIVSLGLAVAVIFVMLGVMLRSVRLGLISVLPNVLPLALTVAYMAVRDIPLHASTAIVFTVSIGLVVDGTIHVLARYREELRGGRDREDALMAAMRGSGRAVVLGALTLLIGFVALSFATFVPIQRFAELSIVAIGTALLAELLVLPALLRRFG